MLHLVQIGDGSSRRVAIVEEPHLLRNADSMEVRYGALGEPCETRSK